MKAVDTTGLVGSVGLLLLLMLALILIVRGLLGSGRAGLGAPAGFGRGALGRALTALLSFVVVYKFFFERYSAGVLGQESMVGLAVFMLLGMALVPAVETLVAFTALAVFLIDNTALFGGVSLAFFVVLVGPYAVFRWFLGR